MEPIIRIRNLHKWFGPLHVLKGIHLEVAPGEKLVIIGPSGSGKSTLIRTINRLEDFQEGEVVVDGLSVKDDRALREIRREVGMVFQQFNLFPHMTVLENVTLAPMRVRRWPREKAEKKALELLDWDESYLSRYLNEGFSGGEKKRNEILQLLVLEPTYAVLDETDSGLDIDALKVVARGVNAMRGPNFGALVITHYQRILNYIQPDKVHVMMDGRVVATGGPELALELEAKGYEWLKEKVKEGA